MKLGKGRDPIIEQHHRILHERRGQRGTGTESRHIGSTIHKISKVGTEGWRTRSEGTVIGRGSCNRTEFQTVNTTTDL
jgi:hypothetical protein